MKDTNGIQTLTVACFRLFSALLSAAGNMQNEINSVVTNGKQKARLLKKLESEMKILVEAFRAVVESTPPLQAAYKKDIKSLHHLLTIAPIGGKITAHFTDTEVIKAFTDYKKRNPKNTAWDAANALIRPGAALAEKWHHVNSAWRRIERIADKQYGINREQWYNNL